MTPKIKLTLFIRQGESRQALPQLYKALEFHSFNDYELSIIDIGQDPKSSEFYGISNTPALLKHLERGNLHYAGDFNDFDKMRALFGFNVVAPNLQL